jgi:hypothetical protein
VRPLFLLSLALAFLALAWLYRADAPLRAGVAFHHVASVRELAKGEFPPRHNLVEGAIPQGHYGPYLVLLGWVARLTGAAPVQVLYAAGLANLLAYAVVFRWLAARLVGARAADWSVLSFLLLWGPWPAPVIDWRAWGWPGTTSLADSQNFFYPQHAAAILLLLLLSVVWSPGIADRPWRACGAFLLGALLLATHPLSGLGLISALAAVALAELARRAATTRRILFLLGLPVVSLALAALWPYYPILDLLRAFTSPGLHGQLPGLASLGRSLASGIPPQSSIPLLGLIGPAAAGAVWCAVLARRRQPFLAAWLAASLAFAWTPLLPLHQRLITFVALPLQLAATGLVEASWRKGRLGKAFVVALLGAGALSTAMRVDWVLDLELPELGFVSRLTPENAVILADAGTSNAIAGLTGRKVVVAEGPDLFLILVGRGDERVRDVHAFLSVASSADKRLAILRRWRVTHVLIDRLGHGGPRLPYPITYEGSGYVLYDVRSLAGGGG